MILRGDDMTLRFATAFAFTAAILGASPPAFAAENPNALDAMRQELLTFIDLGGPVIAVLMVVSVFGLAVALVKAGQFVMARVGAYGFVDRAAQLLRADDHDAALALIEKHKGPVASVMRAAVRGRAIKGEDLIVREEVERIAQAEIETLERGLPLLALVAMVSPLLGLLGTVTGLIEAFQALAAAGDRVDPAILASGIWEALLTTVMGLAIGIPAAIIHTLMQRTVDVAAKRMEDAATQVFTVDLYRARAESGLAPAAA
jgi:biopolymer transport protein ExbB